MSDKKQYKELSDLCNDCKDQKELAKLIAEDSASVVRGHTPDDIEGQCLRLCQQYLAGNWSQLTRDQITVERLVGGWVNQLYYVQINEIKQCENVPQEVAIKFDMDSVINRVFDDKKLKDITISLVIQHD